jgi:hypothetical protein
MLNSINIDFRPPFVNLVPACDLNRTAAAAVSGTAEEQSRGGGEGYLLGDKAVFHGALLTVIISIQGGVPAGNGASLSWLLPLVEARIRELAARPDPESGYGG